MQKWKRRIGFGLFLIALMILVIGIMQFAENSEDMKYPTIFLIGMIGAVLIWFREINKERKRLIDDSYRRKNK